MKRTAQPPAQPTDDTLPLDGEPTPSPATPTTPTTSAEPPPGLPQAAADRWRTILPILTRLNGVFDTALVETYCRIWARWRAAEDSIAITGSLVRNPKGHAVPTPYIAISNQAATQVRALERQLGLTDVESVSATDGDTGETFTRRELAAKLGVHMMTVTKWEQDGMPVAIRGRKGKPSQYGELQVRRWLANRADATKVNGVADVAIERARKEKAQAMVAEQLYETRRRDLLPRSEVERTWAAESNAVRTLILTSYTTHADRIFAAATLHGLPGVERALKELATEILRELADTNREHEEVAAS